MPKGPDRVRRFPVRGLLAALAIAVLGPPVMALAIVLTIFIPMTLSDQTPLGPHWREFPSFLLVAVLYSYALGGAQAVLSGLWCGARIWRSGTFSYGEAAFVAFLACLVMIVPLQVPRWGNPAVEYGWVIALAVLASAVVRWGLEAVGILVERRPAI